MLHPDDPVPTAWKTGHNEVELPHGFGASPITDDERERWLKQARELVPGMLAHTKKDAPDLAHFQTKHDVEIYRGEVPGSPFKLIRGQCTCLARLDELLASFTCPTTENYNRSMRTVDEMYKDGRVVADISGAGAHQDEFGNITSDPVLPHASLRWSSFNTQWPVWNRDFLFVQYVDRGEFEGRRFGVVLSLSVERPDVPNLEASHSFVRGSVLGSGYVALENPDGSLQITYLVRVDAAGAIPVWLQNIAAPAQGLNVSRMRAVYGVRRYAESILAPKASSITDPALARANAYYFKVAKSSPLVFPVLPPHHGHESSLHFAVLTADGTGMSLSITAKSGSGVVPAEWREPRELTAGTVLSGSFPQAPGTAYEVAVSNAGRDAHVVIKLATQRAGAAERK